MRLRIAGAVLCCAVVASACGAEGAGAITRQVARAIDRTRDQSREYRYIDETLDGKTKIQVDGKVVDDLRYSGTVSVNGRALVQAVVSDDSLAVRILDTERAAPVIEAARRSDPITGEALAARKWVIDHTVAPPLLAAAAARDDESERTADRPQGLQRQKLVGDDPFIDSAQLLNYAERAARGGISMFRFDPEDIEYNPLDDPWSEDSNEELEDRGLSRFDLAQPPLPPPAERGQRQALPTIEHFRKMAVYIRAERVVEIKEQIDIGDRREFRRAEQGRTAAYYLRVRDEAERGAIQDEIRERRMEYRVTKMGNVSVKTPRETVRGLLGQVLPALKQLFEFNYVGGDARAAVPGGRPLPGIPGASPLGTPTSTTTSAPADSPQPATSP